MTQDNSNRLHGSANFSQYSFCNGENPQWQANLVMKMNYAQHCKNNPGTC